MFKQNHLLGKRQNVILYQWVFQLLFFTFYFLKQMIKSKNSNRKHYNNNNNFCIRLSIINIIVSSKL